MPTSEFEQYILNLTIQKDPDNPQLKRIISVVCSGIASVQIDDSKHVTSTPRLATFCGVIIEATVSPNLAL